MIAATLMMQTTTWLCPQVIIDIVMTHNHNGICEVAIKTNMPAPASMPPEIHNQIMRLRFVDKIPVIMDAGIAAMPNIVALVPISVGE